MTVKANKSEKAHTQLQEEEVLAQMHHLTAAAQETTAGTLSWMLYELAKHPEYQTKIRNEVRAARAAVRGRGDADFNIDDLSGMEVTLAAIKVHIIYSSKAREAKFVNVGDAAIPPDRVPPLARSLNGRRPPAVRTHHRRERRDHHGNTHLRGDRRPYLRVRVPPVRLRRHPFMREWSEFTSKLTPRRHRLPSVWGDDAEVWNPDRFFRIDAEKQVKVGVYANL